MYLPSFLICVVLAVNQAYGSQQIQMPEAGAFMSDEDLMEQIERLKHNVTELWTNFNELKTVLTQTLNHLRVHQAELEETVHVLEHKHESSGNLHGSYTDDHHHHSGESHSGDAHSHGHDDHHHHSGEQHSHSGEQHSHSGESHSHGSDSHSHSGESHSHGSDSHSHGGEANSHDGDHHHESWSHSHSSTGHDHGSHSDHNDLHQHHGDSHEKGDDLQQAQQGADSMIEPLVMPTSVQQHYHNQKPSTGSLRLINDIGFNSHHHHHHHHSHDKKERNRTVEVPKYSENHLYDFAICNVQPNRAIPENQQQEIMGRINLWQKKSGGPLNIHVRLQGFDMGDHQHHDVQQSVQQEAPLQDADTDTPVTTAGHKHGFHIHASGDLSNGCQSTGPHFNPKGVTHGGPNALVRHVGDLGNIECDDHGNANILFNDEIASLKGPYSVIGKAIVIHSKQDDLGLGGDDESLKTGNAGTRLACCVIEKVDRLFVRTYNFIKKATLYQN